MAAQQNPYDPVQEDVIYEWTDSLDVSEGTKRHYRQGMKSFCEYVRRRGLNFDNLEPKHVNDFKQYLLKTKKQAPAGVSLYLSGVRSYYRFAEDQGLRNIARNVRGIKSSKGFKKDVLSPEQAENLLEATLRVTLSGKRDYAMINLMLRTGLRDIEVSRANIFDLRDDNEPPVLYIQGKGHDEKDDFVILSESSLSPIKDYLAAREAEHGALSEKAPLFASESNRNIGGRMNPGSISQIVKAALRRIGLGSSRYTAHSLRHTAITFALLGGATEAQVQEMARHVDINTTLLYSHHRDRLKDAPELKIDSVLPYRPLNRENAD